VPEFKSRAEKWFWYLLFGMRGALIAGAVILVFILILWRLGREE
jgi:hypothetical protein